MSASFDFVKWYPTIINGICATISLSFTIAVLYFFINHKTVESISKIRRSTKYLACCCMILFTITCIIQIFTPHLSVQTLQYKICVILQWVAWFIAQSVCYMVYINRLYYTFHCTEYHITNSTLCVLYALISLFILCHFGTLIIFIIEYKPKPILDYHSAAPYYAMFYILIEIVDLILCIFIVYVFASRLIQLISEFNDDDTKQQTNNIHRVSILTHRKSYVELNRIQKLMVKIMTQYFVLTTICILATQIFLILRVLAEISFTFRFDHDAYLWKISIILLSIQCCVSVLGIFLMFEFGNKLYYICCAKLDKYCSLWCKLIAKTKVTQVYELSIKKQETTHNEYVQMTE